jgi:ankyrin repeat protein
MDTLPLPPRPSLAQYRKRAKGLVKAARSTDRDAIKAWAREWLGSLAQSLGVEITPFVRGSIDRAVAEIETRVREKTSRGDRDFTIADAQFLIARAHSFENWSEFASHLEHPFRRDAAGREFEAAADAVVSGDLATLDALLKEHPDLVRARSARTHKCTLLHYVAANGVEDYRQRTPPNAVAVARRLLEAGAEVDALAETYGGGQYQTTMNLLVSSVHPAGAGLQSQLVETLLDFGAAIDGLDDKGSPLMTALAFNYRDAAATLVRRGARLDSVIAAAAVGRLDLVKSYVVDAMTLRAGVPLLGPVWMHIPDDPKAHIELAFVWACKFGRTDVAEYLLDVGVPATACDTDHMTALHWAAASGSIDLVRSLVRRGAALEAENDWGGTVLDSMMYFARNDPVPGADYLATAEVLIAAGANVHAVSPFPTGIDAIDDLLRRHGAA